MTVYLYHIMEVTMNKRSKSFVVFLMRFTCGPRNIEVYLYMYNKCFVTGLSW